MGYNSERIYRDIVEKLELMLEQINYPDPWPSDIDERKAEKQAKAIIPELCRQIWTTEFKEARATEFKTEAYSVLMEGLKDCLKMCTSLDIKPTDWPDSTKELFKKMMEIQSKAILLAGHYDMYPVYETGVEGEKSGKSS